MDAMRWDLSGIAVVEQLDHLYTFPLAQLASITPLEETRRKLHQPFLYGP